MGSATCSGGAVSSAGFPSSGNAAFDDYRDGDAAPARGGAARVPRVPGAAAQGEGQRGVRPVHGRPPLASVDHGAGRRRLIRAATHSTVQKPGHAFPRPSRSPVIDWSSQAMPLLILSLIFFSLLWMVWTVIWLFWPVALSDRRRRAAARTDASLAAAGVGAAPRVQARSVSAHRAATARSMNIATRP